MGRPASSPASPAAVLRDRTSRRTSAFSYRVRSAGEKQAKDYRGKRQLTGREGDLRRRRSHGEATENYSFGGLPPARSNKRSNRSVTRFPWPGRWRGFKACARAIAV